ncbi:hypothetical protein HPP92_010372 [Vanilla planifolia]|uniref:Solute carrier family 40 member n=1 Tax=Vanilla planifolia TaxID=51239 RepID=A0A835V2E9_VANPL|nr:hypothetical protein HPP92_010372 [Vanilla planifolia]
MGLVIVASRLPAPGQQWGRLIASQLRLRDRHVVSVNRLRPPERRAFRFIGLTSKCLVTYVDVDVSTIVEEEKSKDLASDCSSSFISDSFDNTSLKLIDGDDCMNSLLKIVPILPKYEKDTLAATPTHPGGLYALYASFFIGNLVEQLWNFAWPTAVATLHPSLLPVAVVGFFAKLSIFVGAPLVGNLMDHFPRMPVYHCLNTIQTAAQLLSAAMLIHALRSTRFDRLSGLALGVAVEREWVVLLAGSNRPVALANANAMLNRIDLLCEIAGASIFGILLTKFPTVTCLKLASGLMICALPILVIFGQLINRISNGALECSKFSQHSDRTVKASSILHIGKIVENGLDTIKKGWIEYRNQPALPASLAYIFLYFNVALAPGSIMTAFLMHHGVSPSIIGGFSGLSAFMGVAATFISAILVEKLGILKAGAFGLVFQGLLLTAALGVLCIGTVSQPKLLFCFLLLIVLSRLGHMSYDVVGTQILQTGIPISKANLIGTTEISIASLAEFAMLGVALVANDVQHFGFLSLLSVSSVLGAAFMFCCWLKNPSDEQRKLFSLDAHFPTCEISNDYYFLQVPIQHLLVILAEELLRFAGELL